MPIYHILFISWPINGQTHCTSTFCLLWIKLLQTWAFRYLFEFCAFTSFMYIARELLLDYVVILGLIFWGTSCHNLCYTICHSSCIIYIPTSNAQGSSFFISLTTLIFSVFFGKVILMVWGDWASFRVLLGHLCIFFREMSIQVLCPFFNCVVGFSVVVGILYIF